MLLFQHLVALAAGAILLALVLPLARGVADTARLQATLASLEAIGHAAANYRAAEGVWPEEALQLQGRWLATPNRPRSAWGAPIGLRVEEPLFLISAQTPLLPPGGTSAFLTTPALVGKKGKAARREQLSIPPPGDQAWLENERQRLQCHPNGIIEPC